MWDSWSHESQQWLALFFFFPALNFPGKNTGVSCHFFPGIEPTSWHVDFLPPSNQGSQEDDNFKFIHFFNIQRFYWMPITCQEKEVATHSSVLAWRTPGTGEPGGLPSMGSHRVGHDWCDLAAAAAVSHAEYCAKPWNLTIYHWGERYVNRWFTVQCGT